MDPFSLVENWGWDRRVRAHGTVGAGEIEKAESWRRMSTRRGHAALRPGEQHHLACLCPARAFR